VLRCEWAGDEEEEVSKPLPGRRRFVRKSATRPHSTTDLLPPERRFVTILQQLGFGQVESVRIRGGALVLDPWPTLVQVLKFGAAESPCPSPPTDFELKKSMADLIEYIRGVDDGVIRCLDVRHGLPFSMEVEYRIPRGVPDVKGEHVEAV
jgi:hypothetical protein